MAARSLNLTPELVARVHRAIEDSGPEPGIAHFSEADYDAAVAQILQNRDGGRDAWLFAYGSLIWKPEIDHLEEQVATAHGWRRSFCLKINRWRGTSEKPGLMMALDRGGQCNGIVLRLAGDTLAASLGKLFRREMTRKPPANMPRWINAETASGPLRALAFVCDPRSRHYAGKLSEDEIAEILSKACGHWGSGADYLRNTIVHLEQRGIHDRYLWRLQNQVAQRIAARVS